MATGSDALRRLAYDLSERLLPSRDALLYFEGAEHRFREVTEVDRHRTKPEREANSRRPERRRKDIE
jgi:hypothetical protein